MGVQEFERFSECEGEVLECCRKGAFIMLENGEKRLPISLETFLPGQE